MDNNTHKNPQEDNTFLSGIKKENPFSVPENYFNELPDMIAQRKSRNSRISFLPAFEMLLQPKWVAGTLSALVITLVVYVGIFRSHFSQPDMAEYEQAVFENHLAWYSEYQKDFYYDLILEEGYADDGLIENSEFENTEDEALMEYMIQIEEYYMDNLIEIQGETQ